MRRGRILIFLVLIVIIGLAVAVFAVQQFVLRSQQDRSPVFVDIFVAGQNIPQGGDITEAVLSTITIPQENVVAVMFTRDELSVLTTNKVARYPLDQGVVITEFMIVDKSSAVSIAGPQWAALVPPGMTAIGFPSSRLSMAGLRCRGRRPRQCRGVPALRRRRPQLSILTAELDRHLDRYRVSCPTNSRSSRWAWRPAGKATPRVGSNWTPPCSSRITCSRRKNSGPGPAARCCSRTWW